MRTMNEEELPRTHVNQLKTKSYDELASIVAEGKNIPARLPHVHYQAKGAPKKAMKLHRPWETTFKKWFK